MNDIATFENGFRIPDSSKIQFGVVRGQRDILAGVVTVIRTNARLAPAFVIAGGVTIGQDACVRPGALRRVHEQRGRVAVPGTFRRGENL